MTLRMGGLKSNDIWLFGIYILPIILGGPFRQLELECQIKHTVLLLIQRQKVLHVACIPVLVVEYTQVIHSIHPRNLYNMEPEN